MREDPNHIAEIAHTTERITLYDVDLAIIEQVAVDLAALHHNLVRWSARLIYEPPSIGDAIILMEQAQNRLADALSSIENARDS